MDELTNRSINDIKKKLGWAERTYSKLQENKADLNSLQDNFWSFLTAAQQVKFYFSRLIELKNPELSKRKRTKLILENLEDWQEEKLSEDEITAWNIINCLRNDDTHRKPVETNYEIRKYLISCGNGFLSTGNGGFLATNSDLYYVVYNQKEYEIEFLCSNGINAIQKLVEYLNEF